MINNPQRDYLRMLLQRKNMHARRVTPQLSRVLACITCKGNVEQALRLVEKSCDEVETVREFIYLADRLSAGGGCEAAVTAKTICGWAMSRESGKLPHERRLPLKLKWAVHESYVRTVFMHWSEVRCLNENEMGIMQGVEKSM